MKLVVLGGGESGVGAALLGRHLGYEVFLSDKGKLAESYRDELITHRIAFEEGQHSMDRIFAAELVVKSPGIPDTVPMVVALRERGIEVISEIEFAGRHTEAKMVCITGSNGKTTTTLLTYHILWGVVWLHRWQRMHIRCMSSSFRVFSSTGCLISGRILPF